MMKSIALITFFCTVLTLSAQKVGSGFDVTVNLLVESGMKKFVEHKGQPTTVMSDRYFNQFESNLVLENFQYCLITEYPAGSMIYFTGLFYQTYNYKKAIKYYKYLADRVEKVQLKCCTMRRESGIDLEHEKSTYYKPFARPNDYAKLHLKVGLENIKQTNGKLKYHVLFYIFPNPLK